MIHVRSPGSITVFSEKNKKVHQIARTKAGNIRTSKIIILSEKSKVNDNGNYEHYVK